ncbi:MAG: energy-coupling factor transporter transmembrane component T family protein [Collinsella sp.]
MLIALSLAGGLAYGLATRGAARTLGALRWQLPVILIIAVLNPLFSASGSTELFRIGMRAVYLESMVYGLCMGGLFVASVLWFEAAASMLEYDKVLALLGNAAPVIALMISMCMRLIPQFLRRGRTVLAVQDAIDVPGRAPADPVRSRLRASSALMGWGMEDSLERADAMCSRGWGAATRRTTYARYRLGAATLPRWLGLRCLGCRGGGGVDRDNAVFVLPAAFGAGAVAGLCRVRCWMVLPCVCTRSMRRGLADGSVG